MRTNYKNLQEEIYECEKTGQKETVYRHAKKENGHKKWIFCIQCDKKHNFIKL